MSDANSPPGLVAAAPVRDQATSTFTHILERLVHVTPCAQAAALVDFEGETVDYAGRLEPFEVKIAAAHWLIVLSETSDLAQVGVIGQITVRTSGAAYHVRRLEEGYAIVMVLRPRAAFAVSERAMLQAVTGIAAEAGWAPPATEVRWFSVEVESEHLGRVVRPKRLVVQGKLQPVEVMGSVVGLAPREKGFRVRLPSGAEMMLVRERLGCWFADEQLG